MKFKIQSTKNLLIFFICAGIAGYDILLSLANGDMFWLAVGVFFAFVAIRALIAAFSKSASDSIEEKLQRDRDQ